MGREQRRSRRKNWPARHPETRNEPKDLGGGREGKCVNLAACWGFRRYPSAGCRRRGLARVCLAPAAEPSPSVATPLLGREPLTAAAVRPPYESKEDLLVKLAAYGEWGERVVGAKAPELEPLHEPLGATTFRPDLGRGLERYPFRGRKPRISRTGRTGISSIRFS